MFIYVRMRARMLFHKNFEIIFLNDKLLHKGLC